MSAMQNLPEFSRDQVNRAASVLRDSEATVDDRTKAVQLISDWRMAHYSPVETLRATLNRASTDVEILVAARLKRIPTMLDKLRRVPRLTLWDLQDVGGLRAVVGSPLDALALGQRLMEPFPHFTLEDRLCKNYLEHPKASGYRSIHLVYSFHPSSGEDPKLDGLKVELQIRSRLQHAWATSNEIVGTYRREALKSGEGDRRWLRFFALAGSLIAEREGLPIGPSVPTEPVAFLRELTDLKATLNVFDRMSAYNVSQQIAKDSYPEVENAQYFVLAFDLATRNVVIAPFGARQFEDAIRRYREKEQLHLNSPDHETVFVSVESVSELEEAYPNYFADTEDFLLAVYTKEEVAAIDARSAAVEPPHPED